MNNGKCSYCQLQEILKSKKPNDKVYIRTGRWSFIDVYIVPEGQKPNFKRNNGEPSKQWVKGFLLLSLQCEC